MTETPAEARRSAISAELQRLEESAQFSAQAQFEQAKFWRGVHLLFGVPAAVLAAIAGATGLASVTNRVSAAYLALAAAAFGALATTLNTGQRTSQAQNSANAYLEVQTQARQLREIDLQDTSVEDLRSSLADLTTRRDDINKSADIPSFYAYWRGKGNIAKGRQTYAADQKSPKGK